MQRRRASAGLAKQPWDGPVPRRAQRHQNARVAKRASRATAYRRPARQLEQRFEQRNVLLEMA
eukprot:7612665-Lingulodinium_polyedra.AAC.1